MIIGDSEGVVIARRFDNRNSLGELFLGFVVAFEDDERSRALRPADAALSFLPSFCSIFSAFVA